MPAPTKNDWNSFHVERFETKVNVLYYYLCQGGYNMQEIAEQVLRDNNPHAAQRVSLITRCYGFGGNNGGAFRSIGATKDDVAAFVRAYPNGCGYDGTGQVMKAFLQKRVQTRNKNTNTTASTSPKRTTYPWDSWPEDSGESDTQKYYEEAAPENKGGISRTRVELILIAVVFCILKFGLDWNWIASIIVAILGVGLTEALIMRAKDRRG